MRKYGLDLSVESQRQEADDEAVAALCERMLSSEEQLERFAQRETEAAKTLREHLHALLAKIKKLLRGGSMFAEESELVRAQETVNKWHECLSAAIRNAENNPVQTSETAQDEADDGTRAMIDTVGKYTFVRSNSKLTEEVLQGNDPHAWGQQTTDYINDDIRHGKDVLIHAADGDDLLITHTTAWKAASRNTITMSNGTQRPMTDDEYRVKLEAELHIDEIAKVSRRDTKTGRKNDTKNHSFARDGYFHYRTAYYQNDDGYYKLTISVGEDGALGEVYNIGKIDKTALPTTWGQSPVSSKAETANAVSDDSISTPSAKRNPSAESSQSDDERSMLDVDAPITREVVAAVQSIGRKSVNEFTPEDIRKAEPFARRYWKEMGVKSPFFRAWFGDWRAHNQSVVHIADEKDDSKGVQRNEDTGWDINVSRQVFTESVSHTATSNRAGAKLLPYINSIVKNAILLDSVITDAEKGSTSVMMHSFYGVVRDGSDAVAAKLFVQEMRDPTSDGTIKRSYQLKGYEIVKNAAQVTAKENESPARISDGVSSIRTVSDLFAAVKLFDKNFYPNPIHPAMLNADGTPRIVYHGTGNDFNAFDRKQIGENYRYSRGSGFFFTTNRQSAERYALLHDKSGNGGRVIEAYLSMKHPYEITCPSAISPADYYDTHSGEIVPMIGVDPVDGTMEYDGVIIRQSGTDNALFIPVEPTQIKSATENIGTFDGTDDNYRSYLDVDAPAVQRLFSDFSAEEIKEMFERLNRMKSTGVFALKDIERMLDTVSGGNKELRNLLDGLIGRPHREATGRYARGMDASNRRMLEVGERYGLITYHEDKDGNRTGRPKKDKAKSAAVQRYGEGYYQHACVVTAKLLDVDKYSVVAADEERVIVKGIMDVSELSDAFSGSVAAQIAGKADSAAGAEITFDSNISPYTLDDLKRDRPDDWQSVIDADTEFRMIYEDYYTRINSMLRQIYPNAFTENDDNVDDGWHTYVTEEKEKAIAAIIADESLKDTEARRFILNAFRDGFIKTTGSDIDKILPPVSRFNGGNRKEKRQSVIEKLMTFFEEFFGIA